LFCTLFCSSRFRAVTQRENLEADRVQPRQPSPKPPTDRAEERVMCGLESAYDGLLVCCQELECPLNYQVCRLGFVIGKAGVGEEMM